MQCKAVPMLALVALSNEESAHGWMVLNVHCRPCPASCVRQQAASLATCACTPELLRGAASRYARAAVHAAGGEVQGLGRAMRIGTNHGSLSARILCYYGDTPRGMVETAFEFADICRDADYHNFLFSMKASNPLVMVQVCALASSSSRYSCCCIHSIRDKARQGTRDDAHELVLILQAYRLLAEEHVRQAAGTTRCTWASLRRAICKPCSVHPHALAVCPTSELKPMRMTCNLLSRDMCMVLIRAAHARPCQAAHAQAGEGEDGRMKSAIGIGALLMDGLGDTIRVSLTEDPSWRSCPAGAPCWLQLVRMHCSRHHASALPGHVKHWH